MKPKLQAIYYLAALISLVEAAVLSLHFACNVKGSFLIACLILVASVGFLLCVMGLGHTFQSIEKRTSPETALHVRKTGFIQIQWFYLLHSSIFCVICLYWGIYHWMVISLIKEILLWAIAFPCVRGNFSSKEFD